MVDLVKKTKITLAVGSSIAPVFSLPALILLYGPVRADHQSRLDIKYIAATFAFFCLMIGSYYKYYFVANNYEDEEKTPVTQLQLDPVVRTEKAWRAFFFGIWWLSGALGAAYIVGFFTGGYFLGALLGFGSFFSGSLYDLQRYWSGYQKKHNKVQDLAEHAPFYYKKAKTQIMLHKIFRELYAPTLCFACTLAMASVQREFLKLTLHHNDSWRTPMTVVLVLCDLALFIPAWTVIAQFSNAYVIEHGINKANHYIESLPIDDTVPEMLLPVPALARIKTSYLGEFLRFIYGYGIKIRDIYHSGTAIIFFNSLMLGALFTNTIYNIIQRLSERLVGRFSQDNQLELLLAASIFSLLTGAAIGKAKMKTCVDIIPKQIDIINDVLTNSM